MKRPSEIFGYPIDNQSAKAKSIRKKYYCPYLDTKCIKKSRTIKYPMGVCSVKYANSNIAICPKRFLENNIVFRDVSNEMFGSINNVLLFSEVRITNVGSFDYVLVKHKPLSSKVEDFCIVEFQTDSTTGTGKLVKAFKDFLSGRELDESYAFGMNTYNTIKLSYIQMLMKGQVMESWNKNIVWIMQKYVFENMVSRFGLRKLDYKEKNNTKYFIYDLIRNDNIFNLELIEKKSSTISNLLTAFTKQPTPSINEFIKALEGKIKLEIGLKIR